jgi:hypothetical protein
MMDTEGSEAHLLALDPVRAEVCSSSAYLADTTKHKDFGSNQAFLFAYPVAWTSGGEKSD